MAIWIVSGLMALLLLTYYGMIYIRKLQFDTVNDNFMELEDELGGKVNRAGFASRPSFTTLYKERKATISISSEKKPGEERQYYINLTMQAQSKASFSLLSSQWVQEENDTETDNQMIPMLDGQFLLRPTNPAKLHHLQTPRLEKVLPELAPFVYILASPTGMILERSSTNLKHDTRPKEMRDLLAAMLKLAKLTE
ncbi:MAG: hypothetical protein AAFP70_04605 [Calditrichota bacterium]